MNPEKEAFFADLARQHIALTFDDVRLRTREGSDLPVEKPDITTRFSRNVDLKLPFVSAAMDTVTTAEMAIAMAKMGGIGVIHAGLTPESQKKEVARVKYSLNGFIDNPVTVTGDRTLESVLNECADRGFKFRTFPVVDNDNGRLIGVISQNDFDFGSPEDLVGQIMTPRSEIDIPDRPIDLQQAYDLMRKTKKKMLPLVDRDDRPAGLYLYSAVARIIQGDAAMYNVDKSGRLRVAAAVPTDEEAIERVRLMQRYVDVVVLDSADGDSYWAFKTLEQLKSEFPDKDVIVGNISEAGSARKLAKAGADGIKVGQGPGSICTTRIETGIGMPQVTAVYQCSRAVESFGIPVCADGGITNRGDITIAVAAGGHSVMMGNMLAGTDESPGKVIVKEDGARVKYYRGMGSPSAMRDSLAARKRYEVEDDNGEPLSEGVESEVPYKGSVVGIIELCRKALVKSMKYVKAPDIEYHRQNTLLMRITASGLRESQPHDVAVIKRQF